MGSRWWATLAITTACVLSGCGGDDTESSGAERPESTTSTTTVSATTAAASTSTTMAATTAPSTSTAVTSAPTTTTTPTTTSAPVARAADPELDRWVVVDVSAEGDLRSDGGDPVSGPGSGWFGVPLRRNADGATYSWASEDEFTGQPPGQSMTAANGLTVEVVPAVSNDPEGYEISEPGWIRLLDADGVELHRWPWGSLADPYLTIDDFDGRRILVSRSPGEPAMAGPEVIYIDLACAACTETFMSTPVSAALVGVDAPDLPVLDLGPLEVCPTWSPRTPIATPSSLTDVQRPAFEIIADALAHCDARSIAGGLLSEIPDDELWTSLDQAARSAPNPIDSGSVTFGSFVSTRSSFTIDANGSLLLAAVGL